MARTMQDRFFARVTSAEAATVATAEADGSLAGFARHRHCVVVTYRRSGVPVPTTVWFGVAGGRLYFRTEAHAAKVRRIRADGRVRVAPSTARGAPCGSPITGTARILPADREHDAEAAIGPRYGLLRALFSAYARRIGTPLHYVEVTPTRPGSP